MAKIKKNSIYLLVGTHKGAFIFTSAFERKKWDMQGPFFKGVDVNHMIFDLRSEPTLYACINSMFWGSGVQFSRDFGETWEPPESGVRFEEGSENTVKRVWHVAAGRENEHNVLYTGVDPGALFKTEDGGRSWKEVKSLTNHPTRDKWQPGMGGMMVHSICFDPDNTDTMYVGISAAGTFATEDGGENWEARNKNVRADFMPEKYPEVGQCVHHMGLHPKKKNVLFQQNHCGVYRSDNCGKEWTDISEGLPSRFGFPLVIHPHDPDTIYVIPEEGAEFRYPVNGDFAVYRSKNRGENWQKLDNGLPNKNAFLQIYRQAMTADTCDPCGIFVGTSTGQIFFSRDEGDTWDMLTQWLPPIYSLHCAVL